MKQTEILEKANKFFGKKDLACF